MFVSVFSKKLTRVSLAIVLVPGPSGNTKLAYCASFAAMELQKSLGNGNIRALC